ncbi:hypothetical protein GY45DRAFT_144074 [Cubamyces sp. BRFM 1775]|nr:hypothetical protein GY45DRAFT_144074 [Cubamyces sp. BRFM 1775]
MRLPRPLSSIFDRHTPCSSAIMRRTRNEAPTRAAHVIGTASATLAGPVCHSDHGFPRIFPHSLGSLLSTPPLRRPRVVHTVIVHGSLYTLRCVRAVGHDPAQRTLQRRSEQYEASQEPRALGRRRLVRDGSQRKIPDGLNFEPCLFDRSLLCLGTFCDSGCIGRFEPTNEPDGPEQIGNRRPPSHSMLYVIPRPIQACLPRPGHTTYRSICPRTLRPSIRASRDPQAQLGRCSTCEGAGTYVSSSHVERSTMTRCTWASRTSNQPAQEANRGRLRVSLRSARRC